MEDASALRADEGRDTAAISVEEARVADDSTISEWGNPTASAVTHLVGGHRGN